MIENRTFYIGWAFRPGLMDYQVALASQNRLADTRWLGETGDPLRFLCLVEEELPLLR